MGSNLRRAKISKLELGLGVEDKQPVIGVVQAPKFDQGGPIKRTILCCLHCGAYTHGRIQALATPCFENRSCTGLRMQKQRLQKGRYPATHRPYSNWRVCKLRPTSESQIQWLCGEGSTCVQPVAQLRPLSTRWNERPLFLKQFGLIDEGLAAWQLLLQVRAQQLDIEHTSDEEEDF